jgi:hypoxanthine phosphoribosyltransferase
VHLTSADIQARVAELGARITEDYAGKEPLLVGVLRASYVFLADLSRAVPIPHRLDLVSLAGYGRALGGHAGVRIMKDLDAPIAGRDVVIVDLVVDTGLTLNYLLTALRLRDPASLAVCSLLDRPYRRLVEDLPLRYVGFTVPDEFFVGYGFDLDGLYRGLPDIHSLNAAR